LILEEEKTIPGKELLEVEATHNANIQAIKLKVMEYNNQRKIEA
jgi:hypothetical protein